MGVVTPSAAPSSESAAEPWRSLLVLALFAALLATVGPRHEPWFDEAQAWLIGRDTTLWDLLAHRVRYEGTPGLWHALLWLFSHAGLPFAYLWVVSAALAAIGAWIILTRAPFPYWLGVGIVFSYFVAYQYAIVARSYALDLVLIPLIAVTFSERLQRPVRYGLLLGLCANANAHSFVIVGVLFAEWLLAAWRSGRVQRAQIAGAAVYLALAGAAVLQAWPPSDGGYLAEHARDVGTGMLVFLEAFVDRIDLWRFSIPGFQPIIAGLVVSVLLLVPSFALFWRAGIAPVVVAAFVAVFVFSIVTFANVWHAGILYLFWILALWVGWGALGRMAATERRLVVASVATVVFVHVFYTAVASVRDIRDAYSAGPAVAQMLARGDARVAAAGFKTFAVQPWFAANTFANHRVGARPQAYYVWQAGAGVARHGTFDRWNALVWDRRYDTLVLSNHRVSGEIAHYVAAARAAGYCARPSFPAA